MTTNPDLILVVGAASTETFGKGLNGLTDTDGPTATFESTGEDLLLTFRAWDMDAANEVEVFVNGVSYGVVAKGVNNGFNDVEFLIPGANQLSGTNEIEFRYIGDPSWNWGVTDILLDVAPPQDPTTGDFALVLGEAADVTFGKGLNGLTDTEGRTATFEGTGEDLLLTFEAWDMDAANEVEIFVNGASYGVVAKGSNNGFNTHEVLIPAGEQLSGTNEIEFRYIGDAGWNWGVTDILLDVAPPPPEPTSGDFALALGAPADVTFGKGLNGLTDTEGRTATFEGSGEDLLLTFRAWDMDAANEVEIFVNGASYGVVAKGSNNGFNDVEILIQAGEQLSGTNEIEFRYIGASNWNWGVTDILLDVAPDPEPTGGVLALVLGEMSDVTFGKGLNGLTDTEGRTATFEGTGEDLLLTFRAWDMDAANEVEIFVNGASYGVVAKGSNNGFNDVEILIPAGEQLSGTNEIEFRYIGASNWNWGVTDILLDVAPPPPPPPPDIPDLELVIGETADATFGRGLNGLSDTEGPTAIFESTGEDLLLSFRAWDMDAADEIEVFVNGVSYGILPGGSNDAFSEHDFYIAAAAQVPGTNEIEFRYIGDPSWNWGVTDILLASAPPRFTPTDDRYAEQWHLQAIGTIEEIWVDYTGAGVSVAIYDDGVQWSHPDLDGNYDASMHVTVAGNVLDPSTGTAAHGTAVAGIIAAEADGTGIVGGAFNASITGVNIIDGVAGANSPDLTDYFEAVMQMAAFDVVNNSWGASPGFEPDDPAPADLFGKTLIAFDHASTTGRDGLGTILVKSAGNATANSSGDLIDASRHSITVAAVSESGAAASYSNHGANVLVTAPSSGELFLDRGVLTTDLMGSAGYAEGDYTGTGSLTGFGGTSASAPIVSAVTALMLEAAPGLGWRDVQNILALSATFSDPEDPTSGSIIGGIFDDLFGSTDFDWVENGAENWNGGGMHFSPDYGFGIVNVNAAVRMAEAWSLFDVAQTSANEMSYLVASAGPQAVGASLPLTFDLSAVAMGVEHVYVSLTLSDSSVDVFLTSASGTRVQVLGDGEAPVGPLDWSFGAEAFLGETASGDGLWTLEIIDPDTGGAVLEAFEITWYGAEIASANAGDDTYHYTDEVFAASVPDGAGGTPTAPADDPARVLLDDTDGGADWLNMAAMTGDLDVSLAAGASSTVGGQTFVTLSAGSAIENAVSGDGDDILRGSDAANTLVAQRGDDILIGGAGDDVLTGGRGADLFVVAEGDGADAITDFDVAEDVVSLVGFDLTYDTLALASAADGNAQLSFSDGGSVTFEDVQLAGLSEANFAFTDVAMV